MLESGSWGHSVLQTPALVYLFFFIYLSFFFLFIYLFLFFLIFMIFFFFFANNESDCLSIHKVNSIIEVYF